MAASYQYSATFDWSSYLFITGLGPDAHKRHRLSGKMATIGPEVEPLRGEAHPDDGVVAPWHMVESQESSSRVHRRLLPRPLAL